MKDTKAYRFLDTETDSIIFNRNAKLKESISRDKKYPTKENLVSYKLLCDDYMNHPSVVDEDINPEDSDEEFKDAVEDNIDVTENDSEV